MNVAGVIFPSPSEPVQARRVLEQCSNNYHENFLYIFFCYNTYKNICYVIILVVFKSSNIARNTIFIINYLLILYNFLYLWTRINIGCLNLCHKNYISTCERRCLSYLHLNFYCTRYEFIYFFCRFK